MIRKSILVENQKIKDLLYVIKHYVYDNKYCSRSKFESCS